MYGYSLLCYSVAVFELLILLQAFALIANSPLRIDLSCVLDHVISELTTFLRKVEIYFVSFDFVVLKNCKFKFVNIASNLKFEMLLTVSVQQANRALRQVTLETQNLLVVTYGGQISSSSYKTIVIELSTLIRFFSQLASFNDPPFSVCHDN